MPITKLSNGLKGVLAFTISIVALLSFSTLATANELPSKEEMWKIIQQQQKQIDALLNNQSTIQQKQAQTEKKIKENVAEVEELAKIAPAAGGGGGHGGPGWYKNTSIFGYGEMHYNSGETDQIDLHRLILGLEHEYNEDVRLEAEIEIEHALAGEGQNGEVEIEQAYIEFDLDEDDRHRAKTGAFLIPAGILNENHEPTTFFGVERNQVETKIIPTGWWEGGVAYEGAFNNGIKTDVAVHSGLSVDSTYKVRTGRQKVSEATAKDPAITGAITWNGVPGYEVGGSTQWQRDIRQSQDVDSASAIFGEVHTNIRKGPIGFRALAARWDIDGSGAAALGADEQVGWYAEPSYYFDTNYGEAGIFTRYEFHDNNAGDSTDSETEEYLAGINFWPVEDVVLKADYKHIDAAPGSNSDDIINLGVGFTY